MISFSNIAGMDDELEKVNHHIERICKSNSDSMQNVMNYILQSRGKQLRPILTILCSRLVGKRKDVSEIAALVEICHTASLIHDDVIDNADMRRNQLSVQSKFGKEMAVYAGDFMIFSAISRTSVTNKLWYKDMFKKLEIMCDGEISQFDHMGDYTISEEQYINNIIGKTSSMFQIACVSGAIEGGCNKKQQALVDQFAINFGLAFQIRDDLMDFISNVEISKKTVHNDFLSGYYTLPVIYAMKDDTYGEEVKEIVKLVSLKQPISKDMEERLNFLIQKIGGFNYTYDQFIKYINLARKSLEPFKSSKDKNKLLELLDFLDNSTKQLMEEFK